MNDERAPENVRMVINGREIPCTLRRMPEEDHECEDGSRCRSWLAIPEPGTGIIVADGFEMSWRASFMPAHTSLLFDISVPVPVDHLN